MSLESRSTLDALRRLTVYFTSWKLLLVVIAVASPGPGYDTSTNILFSLSDAKLSDTGDSSGTFLHVIRALATHVTVRLVRWDALYYIGTAQRGHALYEQEWAFGWGATQFLHHLTAALPESSLSLNTLVSHALVGVCLSHACHFLSVLTLYTLTLQLLSRDAAPVYRRKVASTAALLLIVSPAGLFLSSPYAEAPFAMFQLLGMLLCVNAWKSGSGQTIRSSSMVTAGVCFGISSLFRSNGLFNGLVLVEPFLLSAKAVVTQSRKLSWLLTTLSIVGAGLSTLAGAMLPQILAYREYCIMPDGGNLRPWCHHMLPSIYTWVQSHYWGVGLFRYWTLSNLPLFLVAMPMILILVLTALLAMSPVTARSLIQGGVRDEQQREHSVTSLRRLALPQIVLAVLAMTNFHVQIINRISSGYPVWCIVLALLLTRSQDTHMASHPAISLIDTMRIERVIKAMVMYGIIQGGLYASFLPPA